ncbi:hypothetical protein EBN03_22350 [Nocardia stercoris]|uniref:YggT family protein n=1 Tax=Nocardia stercoris TaxID=2483361 RepID=A0A3M2KZ84_9NOCA|nr:hypothetical protein EBN03_22350 [Nocardia stercoris]
MVTTLGGIFAVIEVIYIVLQVAKANTANGGYRFIQRLADPLALFFPGLFNFSNHNLTIIVNYGAAALFWLIVTGFIARLLV